VLDYNEVKDLKSSIVELQRGIFSHHCFNLTFNEISFVPVCSADMFQYFFYSLY